MSQIHSVVSMPQELARSLQRDSTPKLTALELLKRLAQSIGLASLILVMNYGDLLGGGADVRMHVPYGLVGICEAQIADILFLGIVIFILLVVLSRTKIYPWVRLVVAMLVPPYLIWRTQALYPAIMFDGLVPILFAVWASLLVLLLLRFRRLYNNLMKLGDAIGIFFAMFALCSLIQLLWVMHWKPGPRVIRPAWAAAPQPPRNHPRLVWVIFDELSYDQLFEHRAHDLSLPHFDALRRESTLFTNVQPAGYKTVKIIPSLFTGHTVDDFRYRFDNSFVVHYAGMKGWHPLNGSNSLFHDAQASGWRTAVVGWYNPYCTIYGDAIDDCYWNNLDRIDGLMSQRDSFQRNTWSPLEQAVREIRAPARADRRGCNYDVKQRLKTHLDLEQHWMQLFKADQDDFVYLHLSIPHSPNIWSRLNDNYTELCDSSYLDSLALADRELGILLAELQASPRWKDTTLIVEGDHGWRIDLWNWLPSWTDEDDAAARDNFDPRPALIIHQAGQTQPQTVSNAWPLLNVHNVIEETLHGQPVHY